METSADKARAIAYALLLHLAVALVMFAGLWWSRPTPPPSVRGSVIEAVLVAAPPSASAPARPRSTPPAPREEAPPPQPREEPRPQQAPTPPQPTPQAPVQRPDTVERERAARLAQQQAEETARREEQERRRQEQVLLEEQRRQEEAEQRQRLSRMEEERQRQLADIRRQREEAERERELAEERLKQVEDQRRAQQVQRPAEQPTEQPPAPVLGNQGVDESLLGRYTLAIQQAVERNWIRPETIRAGEPCEVRIVQIPGGEVISASVQPTCRYDELGRRSVEAAVLRAQPLPYSGYESVFRREINFTFRAPEG